MSCCCGGALLGETWQVARYCWGALCGMGGVGVGGATWAWFPPAALQRRVNGQALCTLPACGWGMWALREAEGFNPQIGWLFPALLLLTL
jgi:hypothetical protein